jgi:uncharacterized protein (TIGR02466 family)
MLPLELIGLFSVPFWQGEYPNFEEDKEMFLDVVKKFKEENKSVEPRVSNLNGYQSPPTLHHVEELAPLFEYICQCAFKMAKDIDFASCDVAVTGAWLNVNDSRNCMNTEHIHGDVFSGVFYLKCPEGSGTFNVPNTSLNRMWDGCKFFAEKNGYTAESVNFKPVEGDIYLFPSYLPHSVSPNNHDDERISISFNIITLPKGTIKYK